MLPFLISLFVKFTDEIVLPFHINNTFYIVQQAISYEIYSELSNIYAVIL